jgi:TRAP-type C4-dicarboxylate transport system permease small subunit
MQKNESPFVRYLFKGAELLMAITFILLCSSVSIQVIARYVFGHAFGWAEEFPLFIFLWVSFIAAAVAYREGSHLSVDFIADKFPKKIQKVLTYINLLLSLIFIFVLFYYEAKMTLAVRESTFVVMKISKGLCYMGIPLACLIFAVFIIEKIVRQIRDSGVPGKNDG